MLRAFVAVCLLHCTVAGYRQKINFSVSSRTQVSPALLLQLRFQHRRYEQSEAGNRRTHTVTQ